MCKTPSDKSVSYFIDLPKSKWLEAFPKNRDIVDLLDLLHKEDDVCSLHENRLFEFFCVIHNVLCCSLCLYHTHRLCKGVARIEEYKETCLEKTKTEVQCFQDDIFSKILHVSEQYDINNGMLRRLKDFEKHLKDVIGHVERTQYDIFLKIQTLKKRNKTDIKALEQKIKQSTNISCLLKIQNEIKDTTEEINCIKDEISAIDNGIADIFPGVVDLTEHLKRIHVSLVEDFKAKERDSQTKFETAKEAATNAESNAQRLDDAIKPNRNLHPARSRENGTLAFPAIETASMVEG
ncbi:uncharacterized protein LOC132752898 [Ruditapes philippinarum]|uniref:uncharacterized protein LOC132752898 n=1 Tax=Ruditapes philippinarum TaxID=129788 RepID=UPI00295BCE67|nr:uncharacterized protein LOC132752898 [Ruditapes philippinarum]